MSRRPGPEPGRRAHRDEDPFVESGALRRTLVPGTVENYEEHGPSGRVGIGRE